MTSANFIPGLPDILRIVSSQQASQPDHLEVTGTKKHRHVVGGGAERGARLLASHAAYTPAAGKGCPRKAPMSL